MLVCMRTHTSWAISQKAITSLILSPEAGPAERMGGLPGCAWLPSFPLHPHQSALQWTEAGPEEREMVRGPTVSSCQEGARALTPDTCRSLSHHRPNANQAWKQQGVLFKEHLCAPTGLLQSTLD